MKAFRSSRVESSATGERAGPGLWDLTRKDEVTEVQYTWIVETTKRCMNLVAPVARPAVSWNHDRLMRDFANDVDGAPGVQPLAFENGTVTTDPGFRRLPSP